MVTEYSFHWPGQTHDPTQLQEEQKVSLVYNKRKEDQETKSSTNGIYSEVTCNQQK